ncbi:hypothetical protein J5583_06725 [Streptococcus suis]|uniref:hypothetical protein n=1 Tax=Streptococcus suis TaxID=1307 RepID=UPI001ABE9543|nr:hypothetical protein [Streptococcus suis]MBO4109854.1 hypothetical protein [Streptococcus suis]
MNKRIKKKKQKAAYKIPKHIIRLARRWTELDSEIVFMVEFYDIENGYYPKKLVENHFRKYKRINVFLDKIEGDDTFRSNFFICQGAYGAEQLDGEYCDQSCGYSGDDFHGVYYYPIGENLYFAYNYEC